MTSALEERKEFWKIFEEKLIENGEPFSILCEKGGEPTFWATINKKNSIVDICLNVEFLYKFKKIRYGIYIRDNLNLFDFLFKKKEEIENALGFKVNWILKGKINKNTRRIVLEEPVIIRDKNDYENVIDEILPYLMKFKEVFQKYIPNLFDF